MDFSLIGWDPIVSLLAGMVNLILVDRKDLFLWGDGLTNNFVDFSVRENLTFKILVEDFFY